MIEILNKSQVKNIEDEELRAYLDYSFSRLPTDYKYPDYGYFVIVESFNELLEDSIKLSTFTLPSFKNDLLESINMVEINENIVEILVLVDNDINISLIIKKDLIAPADWFGHSARNIRTVWE